MWQKMYCLDIFYKKFRGPIGLQVSDAKLLLCSIINWFEAETLCFYLLIASYILELLVGKPWWISGGRWYIVFLGRDRIIGCSVMFWAIMSGLVGRDRIMSGFWAIMSGIHLDTMSIHFWAIKARPLANLWSVLCLYMFSPVKIFGFLPIVPVHIVVCLYIAK